MKYFLLLFTIIACEHVHSQTFGLTLNITNIKIIKGEIKIAIYSDKKSFLTKGEEYRRFSFKVTQSLEKCLITNLPKGDYAIALFQDENSDGKCNSNFLGVPKEGYGFSNNYKPVLFAPSFSDCKFSITDNKSLTIALNK